MNSKLLAQLNICKLSGTKPNFSALSREYGYDRRTIKKYYDGYQGKPATRKHHSKLDQYEDTIRDKFQIRGATFRSVYEFVLAEIDDSIGTYSNFRKYVIDRGIAPRKKDLGHPRFETPPARQAQVDWKEDITLTSRYGTPMTFQVFGYKLGHSRHCHFIYRITKTQQDVIDCLIDSFQATGGVPQEILFDNMTSIVHFSGRKRSVSNRIQQFAKDFGFRLRFAKVRSPETKGKIESSNKFIEWMRMYDGEFETEEDLKRILRRITKRVNTQVCQATNVPPILLFQKEKEMLQPLPAKHIIESYLATERRTTVGKDALIVYASSRYSTPPRYIGKEVTVRECSGQLMIFHEGNCIAQHDISSKRINYDETHYRQLLEPLVKADDIDTIAEENLRQFDSLL